MSTFFKDFKSSDFIKFVEGNGFKEIVKQEHAQILREKINGTVIESTNNINTRLNRYQDVLCFDHSRVILSVEKKYGNYINANYQDGYEYEKKYICTQAPLQHTCYDFWRMVWMHHTQIIVMLCQKIENTKEKCHAYWNDTEGSTVVFNKLTITTTKIERYPSYNKTTLLITDGTSASQEVTHFNFIQWPDYGTPTETVDFLNFILAVRQSHEEMIKQSIPCGPTRPQPPPIVIHCSAGLGRTGTYCALDISISKFNASGTISIASTAIKIRQQRRDALFVLAQYYFCYRVMIRYVTLAIKCISKKSIVNSSLTLFKKITKQ